MANKTIHELSSIANLSSSDELAIYDVSGSVTGNGTIEGILGTDITGLDTTATNLIDAINQHEETLSQKDLLYADDEEEPTGEVEFVSQDTDLAPSSSTSVTLLSGNDSWSQRFVKISQMFKNIRYLLGKLGSTDISSIGDGSVTGALNLLKNDLTVKQKIYDNTLNDTVVVSTKCGSVVTVTMFQNTAVSGWVRNTYLTLATLDSIYTPSRQIPFMLYDNSATDTTTALVGVGYVNPYGRVQIWLYSNVTRNTAIRGTITYILD